MRTILWAALISGCITLAACGGKSGPSGGGGPIDTLKSMAAGFKNKKDMKDMLGMFCKADREAIEKMMKLMEGMGKGMDMKEMMKKGFSDENVDNIEFRNEKIDGNNATVEVYDKKDNSTETVKMVKEADGWKICEGIAGEMDKEMNGLNNLMQGGNLEELMDNPALKEGVDKAKDALNSPEAQKAMEEAMKPENLEKMKEMLEKLKEKQ